MGKPNHWYTYGHNPWYDDTYWYYECSDKNIKVTLHFQDQTGMIKAQISEY